MQKFTRSLAAFACAAAFVAPAQAQTNLKMQAAWPASLTLYDNFLHFVDRVQKMSGGALKIEAMPAGQVVPAFEVLDATNKKVLESQRAYAAKVVPAKRFMFPPYSFAANYYFPEDVRKGAAAGGGAKKK